MKDFDYDVMQKKKIANNAKHRKGNRKKCNLSTDYMTRKQMKERSGKPVTYNFKKPMNWQDFCSLPVHIQKEYLLNLISEYQTTASDLARMFGVTAQTVTKHCKKDAIDIRFSVGKRMTEAERKVFEVFCNGGENLLQVKNEPLTEVEVETVSIPKEEVKYNTETQKSEAEKNDTKEPVLVDRSATDMAMTEFSMSFAGNFNRDMLYNSIIAVIPKGTPVRLDIKCLVMP